MFDKVKSISVQISERSRAIKSIVGQLRSENKIEIFKSEKISIDVSVASCDGGIISSRMHGVDLALFRSVGVYFVYQNSKLTSFSYLPEKYPPSQFESESSLDEHEALVFKSLLRLRSELYTAILTIEKFSPNVFLFDGSLLPLPNDRVGNDSKLHPLYLEVISLYNRLFEISKEKRCILCGVIKDSRSNRLSKSLSLDCSDTVLCNFLLSEGERTTDSFYSESETNIPDSKFVRFFYIKPVKNDLPLRIEYLSTDYASFDHVSSVIYSLSSISDNFGYPAILVEADMCAAMDGKEMEYILESLRSLDVSDLRRNSRPFR